MNCYAVITDHERNDLGVYAPDEFDAETVALLNQRRVIAIRYVKTVTDGRASRTWQRRWRGWRSEAKEMARPVPR